MDCCGSGCGQVAGFYEKTNEYYYKIWRDEELLAVGKKLCSMGLVN